MNPEGAAGLQEVAHPVGGRRHEEEDARFHGPRIADPGPARGILNALLISCYDLGHQPFGLAEPAAWLRREGVEVRCLDLAVEHLDEDAVRRADLVAFHVPMHTATRLAIQTLPRVRALNADAHVCFYGLYATVHPEHFRRLGVGALFAGEFEPGLAALARRIRDGNGNGRGSQPGPVVSLDRQSFLVPDRTTLPTLDRYARLRIGSEDRIAGYTEASRGCRHACRHCPIVPVYGGRFRIVDPEIVLADVRQQVEAGARHVTFGDPDFLNAPGHSLPLVEGLHQEFPDLTYDVTAKVEHLLRYRRHLPVLRRTGCLFVTTAVESLDDRILALLDKGHTREDFLQVVREFLDVGLTLSPTWIPFTPWTTRDGYLQLLETLARLDLVDHVAPIQLAIRLLIPPGSKLLELEEVQAAICPLDEERLVFPWKSPDPRLDRLQERIERMVADEEAAGKSRREIFLYIWEAAFDADATGAPPKPHALPIPSPVTVPYLTEPWFC